ncbi:hypothetical protein GALMADRAFT_259546 [Galerina marginata CBS 339.88]|uniref:Uncharacterized protein n=1 Tax=Galerina marginata (strain CBS 339.88) TaxID=685588 RepID=A0A067S617_GALM3|nr:hypothetical protein GALMADRAFT_259546 [Galerina marginata CBS 339.88]
MNVTLSTVRRLTSKQWGTQPSILLWAISSYVFGLYSSPTAPDTLLDRTHVRARCSSSPPSQS